MSKKIKTNEITLDLSKANWKKSTFCDGGACVEVAKIQGTFAVRDSKKSNSPVLLFTKSEWHTFIEGVKNGDFE